MTRSQKQAPCVRPVNALGFLCAAILLMPSSVAFADVTFTDSEFVDSDWVVQKKFDNTPGQNGTFNIQQDFGTGNPIPSQRIAHTFTTDGTSSRGMFTVHYRPADVYDPSVQGPISSVDVIADVRGGYLWETSAIQGGFMFSHDTGPFLSVSSFQTFSDNGLVASDFNCVNAIGFNTCPAVMDFSSTGGPIVFGTSPGSSSNVSGTRNRLGHLDNWRVTIRTATLPVTIDVKPGSDPNCFNVSGHGVVPVAILGTADFDVIDVDPLSLNFGAFEIRMRGNKGPLCSFEDVNGDAFDDLVCQFEDDGTDLWDPNEGATATLLGNTFGGAEFEGVDTICVVPE